MSNEMSTDGSEASKRKRDAEEESLNVKTEESTKTQDTVKTDPPSKKQKSDSGSDSDCISQEDLLAQLGLNSVKKLKAEEATSKKVIHPDPPKQSIIEFLNCPVISKRVEPSSQPRKEKPLQLTNGFSEQEDEDDTENLENKEKLIAKLQNNLRNEEAKLLLLRKLYACQNEKSPQKDVPSRVTPATTASTTHAQASAGGGHRKTSQAPTSQKQQGGVQPRVVFLTQPRGQQPVIIAPKLVPVSGKSSSKDGRQVQPLQAQNTSKKTSGKSGQRQQQANTLYMPNSSGSNKQGRIVENGMVKQNAPSQQQTHAEAKIALRKQLERTLLQIPLPKPPVQNWNFVPTVNTQDFTILIGLEGVVDHIVECKEVTSKKPETKLIPPKFCSQCNTDFTPAWQKQKNDSSEGQMVTLCEMCYTQKIKKTLKSDHTTRLKGAFVKALKQEQEVEQKFQGTSSNSKTDGVPEKQPATARVSSHQVPQMSHVVYHPHHTIQPQVYPPHHSIVHQIQQQQQLQHQEITDSGRRQEPRYFTYVGQHNIPGQHKQRFSSGEHDRQREYLLDMIPSGHNSRGYRI